MNSFEITLYLMINTSKYCFHIIVIKLVSNEIPKNILIELLIISIKNNENI